MLESGRRVAATNAHSFFIVSSCGGAPETRQSHSTMQLRIYCLGTLSEGPQETLKDNKRNAEKAAKFGPNLIHRRLERGI